MIQIDLPMPKSCCECQLKTIEEDCYGEVFYYCLAKKAVIREKKHKRYRRCPLIEVKEDDLK